MSKYLIKVSGVSPRDGAGEYDGGDTLAAAKRRAREEFLPHVPRADVAIYTVTRGGRLKWAADVQRHPLGGRPDRDRTVRRPKKPVSARHNDANPKPTREQQEFIQEKIRVLRHEGYPQRQAIAVAYSMAGVPPRPGDARDRGYTKREFDAETKANWGRSRRQYMQETGMLEPGDPHPRGWGQSASQYRREERLAIPRGRNVDKLALRRPGGEHLQRLAGIERLRGAGWYVLVARRGEHDKANGPYDSEADATDALRRIRSAAPRSVTLDVVRRPPAGATRRDPIPPYGGTTTAEELARHIAAEYQRHDLSPFELRQDYGISRPKAHAIWVAAAGRKDVRALEHDILDILHGRGASRDLSPQARVAVRRSRAWAKTRSSRGPRDRDAPARVADLTIRRRPYSVASSVVAAGRPFAGERRYTLTGKRGASYFTMRNANQPHLMFIITSGKMRSGVMEGVWLTDEGGELRVVRQ